MMMVFADIWDAFDLLLAAMTRMERRIARCRVNSRKTSQVEASIHLQVGNLLRGDCGASDKPAMMYYYMVVPP